MAFNESILVALFCILMVFSVLIALFSIICVFSFFIVKFSNKSITASISVPEALADEEEFSSGELKLNEVDEQTAAMIMAIVSDESGIPLSELCFKSIKLVQA